jgi:hypothetical protein
VSEQRFEITTGWRSRGGYALNDTDLCRICGAEKLPHNFVCETCFKRLPRSFRAQYAVLKLQALAWLRENAAKQEEVTPAWNCL